MSADRFTVHGSWGDLIINSDGEILDRSGASEGQGYAGIQRFDVAEYVEHYGALDSTDILLIGYWLFDGTYEAPDEHFREICMENMSIPADELVRNVILG